MLVDIIATFGLLLVLSIPIGVSAWAFLDAARRPSWVWAYANRRQVVWMAMIFCGVVTVAGGLAISSYYLLRIRRQLAAIEGGKLE